MSQLDPALWRDMMAYLRERHAPICRQWFEELEPVALDQGLLQIQTATSVQQNYLQNKCLEPFTEAAQDVTGQLIAVRFVNELIPTPVRKKEAAPARSTSRPGVALPGRPEMASPPSSGGGTSVQEPPTEQVTFPAEPPIEPPLRPIPPRPADRPRGLAEFGPDQMILSPDYAFDTFITGPNNQLAYAASVAVANSPGTAYNPLFIHGGVGLGKTHLLQAICQKILLGQPDFQILYVSCDAFINQFIECVQSGQMHEFRHRYRHVDMLVIDDIHFLGNRERTQEEFFHTFNELYQLNRQIVLSSDAAPSEIPHLEERLVSRFQWGLVANVTKPSYETRLAILQAKARLRAVSIPDDVIALIASKIDSNARELEGAITTIQAHAQLRSRPIDLTLAREALGEPTAEPRSNRVTLDTIIDQVTAYYGIKLSDLQSRRRHKSVTEPRQVCMWLARRHTRFSLEEVGGYFGGRDHTTVMHSLKTVDQRKLTDGQFAAQVHQLDEMIRRSIQGDG